MKRYIAVCCANKITCSSHNKYCCEDDAPYEHTEYARYLLFEHTKTINRIDKMETKQKMTIAKWVNTFITTTIDGERKRIERKL